MFLPASSCEIGVQSGYVYELLGSIPLHGTLTGGQIGSASATYKRTASGDVYITVDEFPADLKDCAVDGPPTEYATATLN
jgi:hypothetical protein